VRRASPLVTVLFLVSAAAYAQGANETSERLESCFRSARAADAVCSDPANDAVKRLDCLGKARVAQLDCLNQVLPSRSDGSAASESPPGATSSDVPAATVPQPAPPASAQPETPAAEMAPDRRPGVGSPDQVPTGSVSSEPSSAASSLQMPSATVPQQSSPASAATPAAGMAPDRVSTGSVSSESPAAASSADVPSAPVPEPATIAPPQPKTSAEIPPDLRPDAGLAQPLLSGSAASGPAAPADSSPTENSNWVISETTSPLDYSPLVAAVTRAAAQEKDAPTSLVVRCRGRRAEILVGTQGTWRGSRVHEVQVEYQVDDRTAVRQPWIASEDGKTARYKDDAIELLRALPDDARLTIGVFDGQGASHQATFQLAGLSVVRKKIELACTSMSAGGAAPAPADMVRGQFGSPHPNRNPGRDGAAAGSDPAASARTRPTPRFSTSDPRSR
jgi:hypothetical protein